MARIASIKDLERRKMALVAESEVYRHSLLLEVQNLRLYGARARRKATRLAVYAPLWKFGLPLLLPFLRRSFLGRITQAGGSRREPSKWRWIGRVITAWQLYRKLSPFLLLALKARMSSRMTMPAPSETDYESEQRIPAATI